ncbi:hypothetical protein PybrP1_010585 [[Pythium] brassicae (nom. inval.)]|nr:hypothetical protein PybrP1_010585 [[Pythium] brassicae (nom. inval.)]
MARKHGSPCKFDVYDLVLWARVDERLTNNKLIAQWHLLSGAVHEVHASRLKFYADSQLRVNEKLLEFVPEKGTILEVKAIKDHWFNVLRQR